MRVERWYNNDRFLSSDKINVSELRIERKKREKRENEMMKR